MHRGTQHACLGARGSLWRVGTTSSSLRRAVGCARWLSLRRRLDQPSTDHGDAIAAIAHAGGVVCPGHGSTDGDVAAGAGESLQVVGVELLVVGIASWVAMSWVLITALRVTEPEYRRYWPGPAALAQLSTLPLIVAGVWVLLYGVGGIYWNSASGDLLVPRRGAELVGAAGGDPALTLHTGESLMDSWFIQSACHHALRCGGSGTPVPKRSLAEASPFSCAPGYGGLPIRCSRRR